MECKCFSNERNVRDAVCLTDCFVRFNSIRFSNVHYIDREGLEQYMTDKVYPTELEKKMKLLSYFKRYMTEHLVKAGGNSAREIGDEMSRIPHLHAWFRTTCAVVMHLTNGSVQVLIDTPKLNTKFNPICRFLMLFVRFLCLSTPFHS